MTLGRFLQVTRQDVNLSPAQAAALCRIPLMRWQLIEENLLPPTREEADAIADVFMLPKALLRCYAEPET